MHWINVVKKRIETQFITKSYSLYFYWNVLSYGKNCKIERYSSVFLLSDNKFDNLKCIQQHQPKLGWSPFWKQTLKSKTRLGLYALNVICTKCKKIIPHTGKTLPFCACVIQEYRFYIMSLSQYHGCCQYYESLSIIWFLVYTMSPCQYYESFLIPWLLINTMSPCLYLESLSMLKGT